MTYDRNDSVTMTRRDPDTRWWHRLIGQSQYHVMASWIVQIMASQSNKSDWSEVMRDGLTWIDIKVFASASIYQNLNPFSVTPDIDDVDTDLGRGVCGTSSTPGVGVKMAWAGWARSSGGDSFRSSSPFSSACSREYSWPMKLKFGETIERRDFNSAKASWSVILVWYMRYANVTVADLDTPAWQCTRTRPHDFRTSSGTQEWREYLVWMLIVLL